MNWFFKKLEATPKLPVRKHYRVTSVPTEGSLVLYSLFEFEEGPYRNYWSFRKCTASAEVGQAWIENIKNGHFFEKIEVES